MLVNVGAFDGISRPRHVLAAADGNVYFTDNAFFRSNGTCSSSTCNTTSKMLVGSGSVLDGLAMHPVSKLVHVAQLGKVYRVNFTAGTSESKDVLPSGIEVWDIAVNASYAFITTGSRVYKWDGSDALAEVWNTGTDRPASRALATSVEFESPNKIAIDTAGNMLISDNKCCHVWLVDAKTGRLRQVAGINAALALDGTCQDVLQCGYAPLNASNPTGTKLSYPSGVAFGPGGWSAYIVDKNNDRILKVVLECAV
jgi:hypothetical protein